MTDDFLLVSNSESNETFFTQKHAWVINVQGAIYARIEARLVMVYNLMWPAFVCIHLLQD